MGNLNRGHLLKDSRKDRGLSWGNPFQGPQEKEQTLAQWVERMSAQKGTGGVQDPSSSPALITSLQPSHLVSTHRLETLRTISYWVRAADG